MISSLAQDLISRSTTSSQVLSLNLTNLVILFVLKAIIFGASNFGFGHGAHGRSTHDLHHENATNEIPSRSLLSEQELLFMLSYLQADSTKNYDCLHRIVCEDPSKAKEYLLAGKIFLKGTEFFGSFINGARYEKILSQLQDAVSYGLNGQDCSVKYQCNLKNR
ncbi:UNVERIFIED_CONTAM: hypothetical protein PYX00_009201 [Menopon gallinae]|uniref:Uncharacterized protein n=1 Tax=Menopon gallinae TaxID=328185 RepID=A0AAW2HAF4_9NEOP